MSRNGETEQRRGLWKTACKLHTTCGGQVLVYYTSGTGEQYIYVSSDHLWGEATTSGLTVNKGLRVNEAGEVIESITEKKILKGKTTAKITGHLFYAIVRNQDTKAITFYFTKADSSECRSVARGPPFFFNRRPL